MFYADNNVNTFVIIDGIQGDTGIEEADNNYSKAFMSSWPGQPGVDRTAGQGIIVNCVLAIRTMDVNIITGLHSNDMLKHTQKDTKSYKSIIVYMVGAGKQQLQSYTFFDATIGNVTHGIVTLPNQTQHSQSRVLYEATFCITHCESLENKIGTAVSKL